jgi:subtilase family serine protease
MNRHPRSIAVVSAFALTFAGLIAAPLSLATSASSATHAATTKVTPDSAGHVMRYGATPPTTADCQTQFQINCYSPQQIEQAYNVKKLWNKGDTGWGTTIAVVDSFGSPTIANDLAVFDATYGLPAPPSLKTITPAGPLPPFDVNNADMAGWAFETTLDVEYAHAMAPGASILVVATPVSETEGVQGLPEMMQAENYVINHHLANVISQSFGATENTFPDAKSIYELRYAFKNAQAHGVPVLASSGDAGATDYELDGSTLYPYRVTSWPTSDPLVTSVGGTQLNLDANGNRVSPDVVWNDGYGAGGGGRSIVFSRPSFQNGVKNITHSSRGVPDISMSAAVDGGVIVYLSAGSGNATGYYIVGGTSEASPLFAGVVSLATQKAHHNLGSLDPVLYKLAGNGKANGIVDVTSGNNSYNGVVGFNAKKGYDLASGLGTVNAAKFVPALASAVGKGGGGNGCSGGSGGSGGGQPTIR